MKYQKWWLIGMLLILCACQDTTDYPSAYEPSPAVHIEDVRYPQTGNQVFSDGSKVSMDVSYAEDGYVMAKLLVPSEDRIKLLIHKDDKKYNYDITSTEYIAFPLQMGDGLYTIALKIQRSDGLYYTLVSTDIQVQLSNALSPFLYPNQIVNYHADSKVVAASFSLVEGDTTDLERIKHLYEYVVTNISYDKQKAQEVQNSFVLPIPDETLDIKTGICFDYASVLASMLRVQNIPTRLVTGYTDIEYHAWVEIYLEGEGWINPKVYFEKETWSRMDPTFAASNRDYEGRYDEVYIY